MTCDRWLSKLDAYTDAELPEGELTELEAHLRECSSCAADALGRIQLKRATQAAGRRYAPSAEFRLRIEHEIGNTSGSRWVWRWLPVLASAAAVIALVFVVSGIWLRHSQREQVLTEVADLHVSTLASANPVDVVSSDRHTVKPWFQGKLPFTFNLPDLDNSDFKLVGARISYLGDNPAAQLLFAIRQHHASVFIVQEESGWRGFSAGPTTARKLAFNVETWTEGGLRYFFVTDATAADLQRLSELLRKAAQS